MNKSQIIKADLSSENRDGLIRFEEWIGFMPLDQQQYAQPVWLARSRRGEWAPFCKNFGERSPALSRRSDILLWSRLRFGTESDTVKKLLAAGFPEPPGVKSPIPRPKKRGRKPSKKPITLRLEKTVKRIES